MQRKPSLQGPSEAGKLPKAEEPGRSQGSREAEEPVEAGEPGRTRGHRTLKKPGKPGEPRTAHRSSLRSRVVLGRLD